IHRSGVGGAAGQDRVIEPFEVRVDDSVLDDLRRRLVQTRLPDQIEGTGWEYGIPIDYLRELVEYWRDEYDWRAQEARLNDLDHFRTIIDGQSIHFVHARSVHEDALPLLMTHGWPGSVVEFLDVIAPLTDPEAHGGRASDAFHVVAPSLPGYAFSEPTRTRGWDVWRIASAFSALMSRLGYWRYGAAVLGAHARRDGSTGVRRRADGHRALSQGDVPIPARLGRAALQRDVLGGDAAWRPLRSDGAAGALRRRPAELLPNRSLTRRSGDIGMPAGSRPERVELRGVDSDRRAVDQHVP